MTRNEKRTEEFVETRKTWKVKNEPGKSGTKNWKTLLRLWTRGPATERLDADVPEELEQDQSMLDAM